MIAAMCIPWSEKKELALAELIEASQDSDLGEFGDFDQAWDLASDVDRNDCIAAGFPDPGVKLLDPRRERLRKMREEGKFPPPPPLPKLP